MKLSSTRSALRKSDRRSGAGTSGAEVGFPTPGVLPPAEAADGIWLSPVANVDQNGRVIAQLQCFEIAPFGTDDPVPLRRGATDMPVFERPSKRAPLSRVST